MPEFLYRFRLIAPWLSERRYSWLSLSVIAVALAWSLRPGTTEPTIRLIGLALQLLGIATVVWGISETRALFGHPSYTNDLKAWIRRFPLLRRHVVFGAGGAGIATAVGEARGYGTHGAGANPTLESRVDALERNIASLHERISQTQKEMDDEFRKAAEALEKEKSIRKEEANAIRGQLEATSTGGVHISAIGASWLFVGVILSTTSPELAAWLK